MKTKIYKARRLFDEEKFLRTERASHERASGQDEKIKGEAQGCRSIKFCISCS